MVRKAANTYQSGLIIIRDPAKIDLEAHSNWLEITPLNYKGGTPSAYCRKLSKVSAGLSR